MKTSNCCSKPIRENMDICSGCGEHCEAVEERFGQDNNHPLVGKTVRVQKGYFKVLESLNWHKGVSDTYENTTGVVAFAFHGSRPDHLAVKMDLDGEEIGLPFGCIELVSNDGTLEQCDTVIEVSGCHDCEFLQDESNYCPFVKRSVRIIGFYDLDCPLLKGDVVLKARK